MMTVDGCHISIDKGDSGVVGFAFENKKKPIALGTRNFRLIIKKHKEDSDGSAIFDVTNTPAQLNDSYIAFSISADITNNEAGSYFWGLRVFTEGYVNTVKEGIFTIKQGAFQGAN